MAMVTIFDTPNLTLQVSEAKARQCQFELCSRCRGSGLRWKEVWRSSDFIEWCWSGVTCGACGGDGYFKYAIGN